MDNRAKKLNKNLDTLFGHAKRGQCRVCENPIEDRRRYYCSDKCRRVAHAVASEYQWYTIRNRVLRRDQHRCLSCGRSPPEVRLHVDHIRPIAKDGAALDPNNLQTLCEECNLSKGTGEADHRTRDPGERSRITAAAADLAPPERDHPVAVRVLSIERFTPDVLQPDPVEPDPPEDLPEYLVDPLSRQDRDALERVREWIDERVVYLDRRAAQAVEPEDIPTGEGEELGDTITTRTFTYQTKHIPCGPGCGGCPHGPYTYAYYRTDDGSVTSKYVGKGYAEDFAPEAAD